MIRSKTIKISTGQLSDVILFQSNNFRLRYQKRYILTSQKVFLFSCLRIAAFEVCVSVLYIYHQKKEFHLMLLRKDLFLINHFHWIFWRGVPLPWKINARDSRHFEGKRWFGMYGWREGVIKGENICWCFGRFRTGCLLTFFSSPL